MIPDGSGCFQPSSKCLRKKSPSKVMSPGQPSPSKDCSAETPGASVQDIFDSSPEGRHDINGSA